MRLGITMGDPSGIGPEIVVRALAGADDAVVYGDRRVLEEAAARIGVSPPAFIEEVTRLADLTPGRPSLETGRAQIAYLEAAVRDAARLDGLVTAPIHKASAVAAGFGFPGHTEFLAARLAAVGAPPLPVTMMFAGPRMRVALATIHCALADVPSALSAAGLAQTIVQTAEALELDFGIARPRLAVAGLNPHAGEPALPVLEDGDGKRLFGDEEARLIEPALALARRQLAARGRAAELFGPEVPDAVFRAHLDGRFDGVVALYHDQGLIPVKLVDFEEAVNVTLGLPLCRTSPDHGVAHDLAGASPSRARSTSMSAALALARHLVLKRSGRK